MKSAVTTFTYMLLCICSTCTCTPDSGIPCDDPTILNLGRVTYRVLYFDMYLNVSIYQTVSDVCI